MLRTMSIFELRSSEELEYLYKKEKLFRDKDQLSMHIAYVKK